MAEKKEKTLYWVHPVLADETQTPTAHGLVLTPTEEGFYKATMSSERANAEEGRTNGAGFMTAKEYKAYCELHNEN